MLLHSRVCIRGFSYLLDPFLKDRHSRRSLFLVRSYVLLEGSEALSSSYGVQPRLSSLREILKTRPSFSLLTLSCPGGALVSSRPSFSHRPRFHRPPPACFSIADPST
ncbi:hypothetical protein Salat_2069900 [Sesamum alatum]|uniref:Uncharacterized protein n=1 Tax=Sesamum alatum TaxID=300844 RepID=A0AAE1Y063_9LAMI|nr:hypothetical protein Salat_2069900 [Sesamum alatum]